MGALPEIVEVYPIRSLSFSRYWRMRSCFLAGVPKSCVKIRGDLQESSLSRQQIVGIILHRLLEQLKDLVERSPDERYPAFKTTFYDLLEEFQDKVNDDPRIVHFGKLGNWNELGGIFDEFVSLLEEGTNSDDEVGRVLNPEVELNSSDGELTGIADAILTTSKGDIIVEYKSGELFDTNGELNEQYLSQLYFYSHLYSQEFDRAPVSLLLKGTGGQTVTIEVDQQRSEELAGDARRVRTEFNNMIAEHTGIESLATPSANACNWCRRRPLCPAFAKSAPVIGAGQGAHVAWATFLEFSSESADEVRALHLFIHQGTTGVKQEVVIGNFLSSRFADLRLVKNSGYLVINFHFDEAKISGSLTSSSEIYELGEEI